MMNSLEPLKSRRRQARRNPEGKWPRLQIVTAAHLCRINSTKDSRKKWQRLMASRFLQKLCNVNDFNRILGDNEALRNPREKWPQWQRSLQ